MDTSILDSNKKLQLKEIRESARKLESSISNAISWSSWCEAIQNHSNSGKEIDPEVIDVLIKEDWNYLSTQSVMDDPRDDDASSASSNTAGPPKILLDARKINDLFDFNTGPLQFNTNSKKSQTKKKNEPLNLKQNIFLSRSIGENEYRALDEFAEGIAFETRWDGVNCLAGNRGSGKSTVMNRIEQTCIDGKDGFSPLVIRVDLGMAFEPEQFSREFIDQICRESEHHFERSPHSSQFALIKGPATVLGNLAHWSNVNLLWAMALLFIFVFVIAIGYIIDPPGASKQSVSESEINQIFASAVNITQPANIHPWNVKLENGIITASSVINNDIYTMPVGQADRNVHSVSISRNGNYVAAISDNIAHFWYRKACNSSRNVKITGCKNGNPVAIPLKDDASIVAFPPFPVSGNTDHFLTVGDSDGSLNVYNLSATRTEGISNNLVSDKLIHFGSSISQIDFGYLANNQPVFAAAARCKLALFEYDTGVFSNGEARDFVYLAPGVIKSTLFLNGTDRLLVSYGDNNRSNVYLAKVKLTKKSVNQNFANADCSTITAFSALASSSQDGFVGWFSAINVNLPDFLDSNEDEVWYVMFLVAGLIGVGLVYRMRTWRAAFSSEISSGRANAQLRSVALLVFPVAAFIVWHIFGELLIEILPWEIGSFIEEYTAVVFLSFLYVGLLAAVFFLPRWWENYVKFRYFALATDNRNFNLNPQLPFFAAFLAQILPSRVAHKELDRLSIPFLQQRLKEVLKLSAESHKRVVILVDDADILPLDQYNNLLRVLRPVSKVKGVSCLIAVPNFFGPLLDSVSLGDAHSTVRNYAYLGMPEFYSSGVKGPFYPRFGDKQSNVINRANVIKRGDLHRELIDVLLSRLKFKLAPPNSKMPRSDYLDSLKSNLLFWLVLQSWGFGPEAAQEDLRQDECYFLKKVEGSYRELLRAIESRLPYGARATVESSLASSVVEEERGEIFKQQHKQYKSAEAILNEGGSFAEPPPTQTTGRDASSEKT